jgi:hypothetical protein
MLGSLDGVVPIDDPHLGHHLGVWRPISLAWAAAERPPELTTLDRVKCAKDSYFFCDRYRDAWEPALRQLIVARFDAEADDRQADGPPTVVVKEPGSHVADLLLRLFPGSRLVFLLRDGRDVVDSWLAAYRRGAWALDEGAFPVTDAGRMALVRWQAAVWAFRTELVRAAYDAHPPDRRVLVRYEDLVARPAEQLARVAEAVGLVAARPAVDAVAARHDYGRVPASDKGDGKFIRSARPGGWRRNLTPAEQEAMQEAFGPTLAAAGYGEGDDGSRPGGPSPLAHA